MDSVRAPVVSPMPEPVLLIIADISGYTRYMTANAKTLSHSQVIITELVEAIIREVELPLEVAKLEGDAVFLFCRKLAQGHFWPEMRQIVGGKLLAFFRKFSAKVTELSRSTTCTCNACTHIEKLRLKVIVHSGDALFHRVLNFTELAGVDVIIVHRLLKNSVATDQYLLMTEPAARDLEFPEPLQCEPGVEHYEDIGQIGTLTHHPQARSQTRADSESSGQFPAKREADQSTDSFAARFASSWNLYCKLWFAPLKANTNQPHLHTRLPNKGLSSLGRIGLATLTLILTPLMLPVGFIFVLRHACQTRPAQHHAKHPNGCNCGLHS